MRFSRIFFGSSASDPGEELGCVWFAVWATDVWDLTIWDDCIAVGQPTHMRNRMLAHIGTTYPRLGVGLR